MSPTVLLRTSVILASLAIAAAPQVVHAQDADSDGIPDAGEKRLGTDPARAEDLRLVIDDRTVDAGDRNVGRAFNLANDVVKCFAAHVGDNRYLLKIVLAKPFNAEGTVFHVYVDWDNDRTNGRQDADWVRGVDVMYSTVNGSFGPRIFTPEVQASAELPARWVVNGDTVYVCDDVKPQIVEGKARFRLYLLSHMAENTADSDSTEWVTVDIPVDPSREAPEPPVPIRVNFKALPGDWELLGKVWSAPDTVVLAPKPEDATGYEWWHDVSFLSRGEVGESLTIRAPKSGRYHVACVVYGRQGPFPGIKVSLNDKSVGVVAGACNAFEQVLFFSSEPVDVKEGDSLTFATAPNSTPYRVGMLMLVGTRPEMPALRIDGPQVWHMPDEPGKPHGRVLVSWRTNRPVNCSVRYALAGLEAHQEEGEIKAEPGDNQRAFYTVLERRQFRASRYAVSIEATEGNQPPFWEGQQARASVVVEMAPPRAGKERPGTVELTVAEPGKMGCVRPVRSGVPLPRGCLWEASHCRLTGPDGKDVPAQFIGWSCWPDRSVKWLIVDFLTHTEPGGRGTYRLQYGVEPATVPSPVTVSKDENGSLMAAGQRLRTAFGPEQPLGQVWADRDGDGKLTDDELVAPALPLVLTGPDGNRYVAGPPDETTVLETGPIRAMVRRAGWFLGATGAKLFRYQIVCHVWRDLPRMHLEISLDVANVDHEMSLLNRLALEVPIAGEQIWPGMGDARPLADTPVGVLQDYDNRFLLGGEVAGERHPGGVVIVSGGAPVLVAAVRDFWRLWPKGFTASRSGLTVDLLPELPADSYQSPADRELVDRLFYWCDGGKYRLRAGQRVTTEVLLDFAPPGGTDALATEVEAFNSPLFAACSPRYYCESGVFGGVYPEDGKTFPRYDENLKVSFAEFMANQEKMREYGFMNYGDWYGERKWNWGNIEYDTQWALALQFAHNGNTDMLWRGLAAATHNADVDTIHYSRDPRQVGKVYIHCLCHTGSYFPADWRDGGGIRSGSSHCHTWSQGQFVYAALMGNYRLRDNAELIAAEMATARSPQCSFYARDAGWTVISWCAAYEATSNPWYLEAARLMVDRMLQRQHPVSGALGSHMLDPSECKHRPQHYGPKPFMTGVMMRGLRAYDQIEPREDVKRAIVRCADWMWNEAWVPADRGFWYSACPTFTSKGNTWTFSLVGDGLAYACLIDKEHRARRRDLLLTSCGAHLYEAGRSGFGKSFTQMTCCTLHALEWMRRMGITDVQPPPPKEARAGLQMRSALVLRPGEERVVRPFVTNPSENAVRVQTAVSEMPEWLSVDAPAPMDVPAGGAAALAVPLRCRDDTASGQRGRLRLRFRLGSLTRTKEMTVLVATPEPLGDGVGIITGQKDNLAPALQAVGLKARPVSEAFWEELQRLRALVIGDEALYYDFAGLRRHLVDVQRFVLSGGTVVVGQVNDDGWDAGLLPWDLYFEDPETAAGAVIQPDHPLFAGLAEDALTGIVSYDRIPSAAPEWHVLMTDSEGRPSVVEASFGQGKVLVVEPSFDRPVVNADDRHADRAEVCRAVMRNLARYLGE